MPCAAVDALCGTLFCRPGLKTVPVLSYVKYRTYIVRGVDKCRGFFASPPKSHDNPSLVNDGTLCDASGANKDLVCHKQRCVDKSRVTRQCSVDSDGSKECHGIGVCTTATTCHYPPTLVVNCTVPALMNGNADKTMVSYPQSINYICNTGYRMNGSATAMCSAGGTLQMPTCNIVNCTAPTVAHGRGGKRVLSYLQQVNYTCDTGYSVNGSVTATCSATGTLTEPKPICNIVNCTVPTLRNGNADKTMVSYLQSVNYTCNTGYRMNGSATATCSADGTLQMPTCNKLAIFLVTQT
ncbi:CUB and sushi domain-containing protein 1-like [Sycon ciliatum]|uniref:CUB and sushi domain-containing protein 1-like n=1 Tax=Sycon ciliatum TaxID=27933 RepID=UPI0031F626B1